jgi:hypothetical protein
LKAKKKRFLVLDFIESKKNVFLVLDFIESKKNVFLVLDFIESKKKLFLVLDLIESNKWIFNSGIYGKLKVDFALNLILCVTSCVLKIISLITIHFLFAVKYLLQKSLIFATRSLAIICRSNDGEGRAEVSRTLGWHN